MYSVGKYKANLQLGYGPVRAASLQDPFVILRMLTNIAFLPAVIGVIIAGFVIGALIGPLANLTTGITIAHTGFTPNPNVTASPGATPLLQLYPLFFAILGLVVIAGYATHPTGKGGL